MRAIEGVTLAALLIVGGCREDALYLPDLEVTVVEVGPSGRILMLGDTMRLTALPRIQDGTVLGSVDIQWAADAPTPLDLTPDGVHALVRGMRPGTAQVRATAGGRTGTAQVVVVASPPHVVALDVEPQALSLPPGRQHRLEAVLRAADGSPVGGQTVTWRSSNGPVATVHGNTNSVYATVSAHSPGQALITASSGSFEVSIPVAVGDPSSPALAVVVSPPSRTVWVSRLQAFHAAAYGSNGALIPGHPVEWSVADTTVATIDAGGEVLGRTPGTTRVFAGGGAVRGWATLRVVPLPGDTMDFLLLPNADPRGGALNLWPGGSMGYVLLSETTPGLELHARFVDAGRLGLFQKVGDAPSMEYLYALR